MTTIMTRDQAQALRAARDTDARLLSRKPKFELAAIERHEAGRPAGDTYGHWSKDDLIGAILDRRFPMARQDEAIHVLHHDVIWPDCGHCQAAQVPAVVPTGTGWPLVDQFLNEPS